MILKAILRLRSTVMLVEKYVSYDLVDTTILLISEPCVMLFV